MNAKQSKKTQDKLEIKSGHMMQGICMQWFIDNHSSNKTAMKAIGLYTKILRYTFGYRQSFNYIKQDRFNMLGQQLKSHRDILVQLGVLEWHTTKNMTMYRILEPVDEIDRFHFSKQPIDTPEEKKIKEREEQSIEAERKLVAILKKM